MDGTEIAAFIEKARKNARGWADVAALTQRNDFLERLAEAEKRFKEEIDAKG